MSYVIKLSIGCLLCLFCFTGCSDDDSDNSIEEFYMSAVIDDFEYHMTDRDSDLLAERIIGPSGILKLRITAASHTGENLKFTIADYSGPGTYMVGENPLLPTFIEFEVAQPYGLWSCNNPGPNENEKNQIVISRDDGNILEGNFDFSGQNFEDNSLRRVSEGRFRIKSD